jgi:uncharacterized membrane protein YqjE
MNEQGKPERLAVSLQSLAAGLIELVHVRLELFGVEAREEASRLGELALYAVLAVVFLSLGLTFLAVLLTVLLWDTHRVLALAVFSTAFLTMGAVAFFAARARFTQGSRLWGASLDELDRDIERLRQ